MSQWIETHDGRLLNLENALSIIQDAANLSIAFTNGSTQRLTYASATAAATALQAFLATLQTGVLSLTSITPSGAIAGGGGASSVIRGSGFTTDFAGGLFPTVTVGVQATAVTFVDDGTIYLTFNTALAAGVVDVTYTSLSGQVLKLVNGYTFE